MLSSLFWCVTLPLGLAVFVGNIVCAVKGAKFRYSILLFIAAFISLVFGIAETVFELFWVSFVVSMTHNIHPQGYAPGVYLSFRSLPLSFLICLINTTFSCTMMIFGGDRKKKDNAGNGECDDEEEEDENELPVSVAALADLEREPLHYR